MSAHEAPISRTFVDGALPFLRIALGVAFIAYSANSTIRIGATDLIWLFPTTNTITIGGGADAYWYAAVVAIILFAGQIATSERYPRTYHLFLWPDAIYTGRGVQAALDTALTVLAGAVVGDNAGARMIGWLISWPVGLIIGYVIARWGEELLFGKRRKTRRSAATKET
jgi:hypothetical protein